VYYQKQIKSIGNLNDVLDDGIGRVCCSTKLYLRRNMGVHIECMHMETGVIGKTMAINTTSCKCLLMCQTAIVSVFFAFFLRVTYDRTLSIHSPVKTSPSGETMSFCENCLRRLPRESATLRLRGRKEEKKNRHEKRESKTI
jgi:hypothetical protein